MSFINKMTSISDFSSCSSEEYDYDEYVQCSNTTCGEMFDSAIKGSSVIRKLCATCNAATIQLSEELADDSTPMSSLGNDFDDYAQELEGGDAVENPVVEANSRSAEVPFCESVQLMFAKGEDAVTVPVGGRNVVYLRKKFLMDGGLNSPLRFYLDIDLHDRAPTLFHYFLLGVHYNRNVKVPSSIS